jgi:hypothetical protein
MASAISQDPATQAAMEREFYERRSGWGGWIIFASVIMILAGALNAMHGLVAIFNDEWVVWTNRGDLYFDLTTWGWIHLGVGIVVVLAGSGFSPETSWHELSPWPFPV